MKKYVLMFLFFGFLLSFCGCFTESEDEGEDEFKLTCKIDGVNKTFYAGGFGLDDYDNTYNNFYDSKENDDEYFYFKFPADVAAGPYNKTSSDFDFDYHTSSSENYYDNHANSNITVTVIEWGSNNGDPISGTFSGNLCNDSGCKTITQGIFESKLIK